MGTQDWHIDISLACKVNIKEGGGVNLIDFPKLLIIWLKTITGCYILKITLAKITILCYRRKSPYVVYCIISSKYHLSCHKSRMINIIKNTQRYNGLYGKYAIVKLVAFNFASENLNSPILKFTFLS